MVQWDRTRFVGPRVLKCTSLNPDHGPRRYRPSPNVIGKPDVKKSDKNLINWYNLALRRELESVAQEVDSLKTRLVNVLGCYCHHHHYHYHRHRHPHHHDHHPTSTTTTSTSTTTTTTTTTATTTTTTAAATTTSHPTPYSR
ncbi:hypothetical protein E2C01_015625 [Portunus trituberculatus]|uniref:Uncharacterized protein n=1 Tax=Portunus trituberculatus TaxID=210409 RepID=A0A5B7DNB1_PORTR|nr:hypothetical protein [Portunus trituberculatus]